MGFVTNTAICRNIHYNYILDTCQYFFDNVDHFSYKDYVKADAESKSIMDYDVTVKIVLKFVGKCTKIAC